MKIIYLSTARIPDDWAHVLQILSMCEAFGKVGAEVELIIPYRARTPNLDPFAYAGIEHTFTITKLPCIDLFPGSSSKILFFLRTLSFFFAAKLYLFSKHFDALYTREHLAGIFFHNFIYEVHSNPVGGRGLYKKLWKHVRGFVVLTSYMRNKYVEFGIPQSNIYIAADAVRVTDFEVSLLKQDARRELGMSLDSYVYGYVGTLKTMQMEKGVACGIQALKFLPENVQFVIVGGESTDIEEYQALAGKEGVTTRVVFIGKVDHQDVPKYLKAFDVVVAPFPDFEHYRWYMSPLKIFEYMAAGVPMVVSDLPSLREVLTEETAVFIPPADCNALGDAIEQLRLHPDRAQAIAYKAQSVATESFSWDARAQGIIGFIENIS